jgi:hypothetical protein
MLIGEDPRLQTGAYIRIGVSLYYVIRYHATGTVTLEDCWTEDVKDWQRSQYLAQSELVLAAPVASATAA